MDPELKKCWIEALENDKYRQYRHGLVDNSEVPTAYCCLGVLRICELGDKAWSWEYPGLPPDQVKIFINMNDGKERWEDNPQSFAQIAQYLRDHPEI